VTFNNLKTLFIILLVGGINCSLAFANIKDAIQNPGLSSQSESLFELTEMAVQGSAQAQAALGAMYQFGNGISVDYVEAAAWYRKAAEQGHALAQASLGTMYEAGVGVVQDYTKAVGLYRKAARQNHLAGQVNLGAMYFHGRGVQKDYRSAFEWYEKAAGQGVVLALSNLGVMYEYGLGVKRDTQEASAGNVPRDVEKGVAALPALSL